MPAGTLPAPLVIEQGETFQWAVAYTVARRDGYGQLQYDDSGKVLTDPIDLTGWSARMQARASVDAANPLIDVSVASGHIAVDGPNGRVTVTIPAAETAALAFTNGVFDVEVFKTIDGVDTVKRLVQGKVRLSKEVTR